jgi:hypothetical protein
MHRKRRFILGAVQMLDMKWKLLLLTVSVILGGFLIGAGKRGDTQCTRIRVPESNNLPKTIIGETIVPPQTASNAFTTIIQTVHIPPGFRPVGGGDNFVIVCK